MKSALNDLVQGLGFMAFLYLAGLLLLKFAA